jgi:hypothetical protein
MFANLDDWYVIQSDLSTVSLDLLASLEWAVRILGIDFVVVLGNTAIREEIELHLAPYGVKVVSGIVGPNEVVRFEPR